MDNELVRIEKNIYLTASNNFDWAIYLDEFSINIYMQMKVNDHDVQLNMQSQLKRAEYRQIFFEKFNETFAHTCS